MPNVINGTSGPDVLTGAPYNDVVTSAHVWAERFDKPRKGRQARRPFATGMRPSRRAGSPNGNEPEVKHAMQMQKERVLRLDVPSSFTRRIAVKRLPVALLLAVVTAASLTVASPANADTSGPIRNAGTQKCLTPVNPSQGAAVVQHPCDIDSGSINRAQEWDAFCKDVSCSIVHVVNHESGLCLDARGGATNGTPIQMWTCNSISNENWDYGPNPGKSGSPNFVLRSRVSGTRSHCLDVPGARDVDGLAMQIWGCNGTAAQLWMSGPPVIE